MVQCKCTLTNKDRLCERSEPQSYPIGWTSPESLYKEISFFEQGQEVRPKEAHFFKGERGP